MTAQAARVEEAINIMHSNHYKKAHDNVLALEELHDGATITINAKELELLKFLVTDRIGHEHEVWYEVTHDELQDVNSMAYELASCTLREDRLHRLLGKLYRENT